jgi:hypothetical protein
MRILLWVAIIMIPVFAGVLFLASNTKQSLLTPASVPTAATIPEPRDDADLAKEVAKETPSTEELIKSKLTDPDSARFRNVMAVRPKSFSSGFLFCGEVNAKNQLGGYVGFQPFLAVGETAYIVTDGSIAENLFNSFCLQGKPLMRVSFN